MGNKANLVAESLRNSLGMAQENAEKIGEAAEAANIEVPTDGYPSRVKGWGWLHAILDHVETAVVDDPAVSLIRFTDETTGITRGFLLMGREDSVIQEDSSPSWIAHRIGELTGIEPTVAMKFAMAIYSSSAPAEDDWSPLIHEWWVMREIADAHPGTCKFATKWWQTHEDENVLEQASLIGPRGEITFPPTSR
jgi:hypothetical protein